MSSVFASWDPALNGLAVGESLTELVTSLGARITVTPNVVRLNDELFLVRSLGQRADASGRTLAQRTVAVVGRLVTLTERGAGNGHRHTAHRIQREWVCGHRQRLGTSGVGRLRPALRSGWHPARRRPRDGRSGHEPRLR